MLEKEPIIRQKVLTRPGGKAGTGVTNQQEAWTLTRTEIKSGI